MLFRETPPEATQSASTSPLRRRPHNHSVSRRAILTGSLGTGTLGILAALTGCSTNLNTPSEATARRDTLPHPPAPAASAGATVSGEATTFPLPASEKDLIENWQKFTGPLELTNKYPSEYEPASTSAPAKNVPEPPTQVPTRTHPTFEGAYETLRAYYSALISARKDGRYASQAQSFIHPQDYTLLEEVGDFKELYNQGGWYTDFICSISMEQKEPTAALKGDDGYLAIYLRSHYSATSIRQPDGTERNIPEATQAALSHPMLFTQGRWWVISNDYLAQRLNTPGSSAKASALFQDSGVI